MKTLLHSFTPQIASRKTLFALALVVMTGISLNGKSQSLYALTAGSSIKVSGTSNLHDWDMNATNFTCDGTLTVKGEQVQGIDAFSFVLPVNNLKSKESLMDTRAYKAMKAEEFPKIAFKLTDATPVAGQKTVKAVGTLTIAGVTNTVTLMAAYQVNADESVTYKVSKVIKMTEYKIKPPSFMLGALKTGDDLTIDIVLKMKKGAPLTTVKN